MMGAVTPETRRVAMQKNKSDCILLHLVGLLFNVNYDARNHELKKKIVFFLSVEKVGHFKLLSAVHVPHNSVLYMSHAID